MTTPEILIVADDLSGAADCGIACAARGMQTVVALDGNFHNAEALAIDADTRRMTAADAFAETERIVRTCPAPLLFKKLDSTLRGHIAVELRAVLTARPALIVLAPAFPAVGRTTVGGIQYVNGSALEDILPVLRAAGLKAEVRLSRETEVLVCDAETDDDLAAIVRSASTLGREVIWAGSGGLARHLPFPHRDVQRAGTPRVNGPVLTVVGSYAGLSGEQAARLAEEVVTIDFQPGVSDRELAAALSDGKDVLVRVAAVALDPAVLCEALARFVAPHAHLADALILTGGETARAVLSHLDIHALRLVSELEPGVPLSIAEGPRPIPVVTKAGAFGRRDTLVNCQAALKH